MQPHQITRIRHQLRRRKLTLSSIEPLTPQMLRLGFTSPDLTDFVSLGFDDHIKLFIPNGAADRAAAMRDFTPRRFDTARGTLVIDVALHEAGPATQWAAAAQVGDIVEIGGPRGSSLIADDFDWYLLIGDETGLPAIGRRVEELRPGVPVATFVVTASGEPLDCPTRAAWSASWIARGAAPDDAALLRRSLADYAPPPGDGFIWIAAEAAAARTLRSYFIEQRQHPRPWIKAAGYWKRGQSDVHDKIED